MAAEDASALSAEERAARAEEALERALAERGELWADLQRRVAQEREVDHLRRRVAEIEGSGWWRAGAPLRLAQKALEDPVAAAAGVRRRWRALRRG